MRGCTFTILAVGVGERAQAADFGGGTAVTACQIS